VDFGDASPIQGVGDQLPIRGDSEGVDVAGWGDDRHNLTGGDVERDQRPVLAADVGDAVYLTAIRGPGQTLVHSRCAADGQARHASGLGADREHRVIHLTVRAMDEQRFAVW